MPRHERKARFVWVRARNSAGVGRDPAPQIIFDDIGVNRLEIIGKRPRS